MSIENSNRWHTDSLKHLDNDLLAETLWEKKSGIGLGRENWRIQKSDNPHVVKIHHIKISAFQNFILQLNKLFSWNLNVAVKVSTESLEVNNEIGISNDKLIKIIDKKDFEKIKSSLSKAVDKAHRLAQNVLNRSANLSDPIVDVSDTTPQIGGVSDDTTPPQVSGNSNQGATDIVNDVNEDFQLKFDGHPYKATKLAFQEFSQNYRLPEVELQELINNQELRGNFFKFLGENPLDFDFIAMIPELLRLMEGKEERSIDLAIAKLIRQVFPITQKTEEQNPTAKPDRILSQLNSELLLERPSTILMLARRLSPGHAYLLYLEANKPLPKKIDEKLDENVRTYVEAAHQYNQNPERLFINRIGDVELKDAAPYLRELNISHSIITSLPDGMLNLRKLNCKNCGLVSLPKDISTLQTLDCSYCYNLTLLPTDMCNLQELNCYRCNNLNFLPDDMFNLQGLNCSKCLNLTSLPKNMPNLQELDCSECTNLTSLPAVMFNLQELRCWGCASLTSLPEGMSNLQNLICKKCTSLVSLPERMFNLQELNCSLCSALTSLPENMPNLQNLNCEQCTRLVSLPEGMFNLQELNCIDCRELASLPQDMFSLTELHSSGCRRLSLNDSSDFTVSVEAVDDIPGEVLLELQKKLFFKRFPSISLIERDGELSEGIDAGGVRRHFLSTLMQNLVKSDGFPLFCVDGPNGKIPRYCEEEQGPYFAALGQLLSVVYQSQGLLLGSIFDIAVFQAMVSLEPGDFFLPMSPLTYVKMYCAIQTSFFESNPLASALDKILKGTLEDQRPSLTDNELKALHYLLYFDEEGSPVEGAPEELTLEHLKAKGMGPLIEEVFEKFNLDENKVVKEEIEAVFAITSVMSKAMGENHWQTLRSKGADALSIKLQGILADPKKLWKKLSFTALPSVIREDSLKTQDYLKKWLKQAGPEKLTKFVKFVTGSPTLMDTTELSVSLRRPDAPGTLPTAHSCNNTIDLPTQYESQEMFNEKLEMAIEEGLAGSGFQFG